jgi:chorismate mutase/prephenate dehydratase
MADKNDDALDLIRAELDSLDERLVQLINRRATLAQRVGQTKAKQGLRVYAPDRERQVLDRVSQLNPGPTTDHSLRAIYRELMSASLALERTPRIAVLGPAGTFSHLAARRKFGMSVEFELLSTIRAVFDEVLRGHAEFGLVPVENSLAGGIGETLDTLIDRDAHVCGEVYLAIHHHLLGNGPLEEVTKVYSKPEVFAQCQKWLDATGLHAKVVPAASTGAAAQRAATEPGAAAIAGELAAEIFGLSRIAEFIEDEPDNVTRFLIIGTAPLKPTGADKTSILFGAGHQPGALASVLDVFRQAGVNMTRIESRPDRRKRWDYYFFVDLEGHAGQEPLTTALPAAAHRCRFWKWLGSYPQSTDVA